ncbi:hypothetical protein JHK85_006017 [Glycine max]|nr:hypothetical protein JHK85_006017 [Glycine max]
MALWFVILLTLFAIGESQSTMSFNQADLQAAMADMRSLSYYGFVILLKILNSQPNSLQNNDLTFLMPNDGELSQFSIALDQLHDFILSHSIPTPLVLSHLLHFPNGSVRSKQSDQHHQQWKNRFVRQQCKNCRTKFVTKLFHKMPRNQCCFDM